MAGTLRDDLASLKIDRGVSNGYSQRPEPRESYRRGGGGGGVGLLAFLLWMIPLGLIGVAATYGYRQYEQIRAKPEVVVAAAQNMTPGEAEKLLSAKGYLKSRYQAMIGATVPGRVEHMFVEEGTKVKKGQVLAVLEHRDLDHQLASRQAQLQKAEAELMEARADLKEKEREARRATRLSAQRNVSVEEYERANATREMAVAHVAALEASIKLMAAAAKETEELIRKMSLYAPFDGTVVEKQGEEGEVITSSALSTSTGRSAVVTLADLDEDGRRDRRRREPALARDPRPAGRDLRQRRAEQALPRPAPPDHPDGGPRPGDRQGQGGDSSTPTSTCSPNSSRPSTSCRTRRSTRPDSNKAYLFIPKDAVFEENGHSYVWVVDGKPSVRKRQVEVAVSKDDLARVESGLRAGELVVMNPSKTLRENAVVKIAE